MAKQSFSVGQVLTAAQMTSLQQTAMLGGSATAKTASYILVAADAGTVVSVNSTSATTITVNTGLFSAGDSVTIQNWGSGSITITAGTATVNTAGSLIVPQYDGGVLYFTSASAAIYFDFVQAGAVSPLTTKGDLYTFASSDTRLGVGANNTVLTADSSEATGLKWAAAGGGGAMVKIASASFSAQSSVAIDNVFTSTYKMYYVTWFVLSSVTNADLQLQLRYAGPTTQTANYFGAGFGYKRDNTLFNYGYASASETTLYTDLTTVASGESFGDLTFSNVGNASENAIYYGSGYGQLSQAAIVYSGYVDTQRTYTGFLLKPSSGNITGYYRVYGLEN